MLGEFTSPDLTKFFEVGANRKILNTLLHGSSHI